jgi:hypothetical protein
VAWQPVLQKEGGNVAEIDEKVMEFVKETLDKSPRINLDELFERAKGVSASVAELTKRQFNARYPLQVKRRLAQAAWPKGSGQKKSAASAGRSRRAWAARAEASRGAIRQVFLRFATDLAGAEETKDLVKVLAGVDRYVDDVFKEMGKA